jgi:two-component system, NtrC family, response regulator HydG
MGDKEGQFEAANGGTLFLDEIGNLSYEIQVKLLRAIQERKVRKIGSNTDLDVDVRIIVATNEDLVQAVSRGEFREDLYHRLNEFKINISPLRDRTADILQFANHFLQVANHELERNITGFDAAVTMALERYSWPGNLRELKNVVKRAVLLAKGNEISLDDLPPEIAYHIPEPTKHCGATGCHAGGHACYGFAHRYRAERKGADPRNAGAREVQQVQSGPIAQHRPQDALQQNATV